MIPRKTCQQVSKLLASQECGDEHTKNRMAQVSMNDILSGKIENHDILYRKGWCLVNPDESGEQLYLSNWGWPAKGRVLVGIQVAGTAQKRSLCLESKGVVIFGS